MRLAFAPSLAATLIASIALTACGGDDGETITDAGTWLETYVARLCPKAHACRTEFPDGDAAFVIAWKVDVDACKSGFLPAAEVRASVASGQAAFDASQGRECLAALAYDQQTCPTFWTSADPDACADVLTGNVGAGDACANQLECSGGLSCLDSRCAMPPMMRGSDAGRAAPRRPR